MKKHKHKFRYVDKGLTEICLFCLKEHPKIAYKCVNTDDSKKHIRDCDSHYANDDVSCFLCACERLQVIETKFYYVKDYLQAGYKLTNEHVLSNDKYVGDLKQFVKGEYQVPSVSFSSKTRTHETRKHVVGKQYKRESEIKYIMMLAKHG